MKARDRETERGKERKRSHPGKTPFRERNQSEMAMCDQRRTHLGCGNITLQPERPGRHNQRRQRKTTHRGPTRLFQIILSESAYLIWVLRCERVIQEKPLTEGEIKARWYRAINDRLTINKTTATKIVRTNRFKKLMDGTWGPALRKGQELPVNWMHDREVLVGRTA